MSSKVLQFDGNREIAPVVWRRVLSGEATPAAPSQPSPDDEQRMLQFKQQAEQRVRESHAAGMREGEAAGRARAAAELQTVRERLARSIDEIAGLRARLRAEAEADLIRLSLAIARRVLR